MSVLAFPIVPQPAPATSPLLETYQRAPIEIVGGKGVELFGADGRTYLDFGSGIGVNALGYADRELHAAITEALATGVIHTSNLYGNATGEALAQRLVDKSFAASVFFCNSGAEANEGAFKFARRWARSLEGFGGAGKHEIVALRGGFHGRLFASLAATDRPAYRAPFRPLAPGISICERDIDDLSRALNPDTVAAVIVEPVQGEGGVRVLDPEFLRALRALATERQIALIFDEVQCGLGRTGKFFAYELSGVTPDMVTLAKPLAGGLPMGAVLLSGEIAAAIKPGDHATTFGGGPFVSAVANHVVGRLSNPMLLSRVTTNGAWLGEQLEGLAARTGRVRAVRGVGYIWGMDLLEPAAEVVARAREAGLLVLSAGDYTLRLLPPLIADREELAVGLEILERMLA